MENKNSPKFSVPEEALKMIVAEVFEVYGFKIPADSVLTTKVVTLKQVYGSFHANQEYEVWYLPVEYVLQGEKRSRFVICDKKSGKVLVTKQESFAKFEEK